MGGVDQLIGNWRRVGQNSPPAQEIHALIKLLCYARYAGAADVVEAVAAGDEVAPHFVIHAVVSVSDTGAGTVKVVQRDVLRIV